MPRKKIKNEEILVIEAILQGMAEKKAKEPVVLNFKQLKYSICDAFVICHGNSRTQVEAIADAVQQEVKKETGLSPWHKEGFENAEWILIDYSHIVVHIFQESRRSFYNLEQLWADADITRIIPKE